MGQIEHSIAKINLLNEIRKFFIFLSIIFISSDIFLTIEINRATIRLSQIIFLFLFLEWFFAVNFTYKIIFPKYLLPFFIFIFIIFLGIFYSEYPFRTFIYACWALFNVIMVVYLINFSGKDKERFIWLLKVYSYSFVIISFFGMFQFLLPLIGLPGFLVRQWWFMGKFARINGFCFEPSFFATYMMLGACLWGISWWKKIHILRFPFWCFLLIATTIALSSSRLGWIALILLLLLASLDSIFLIITRGEIKKNLVNIFIAVILFSAFIILLNSLFGFDLRFLLGGTGLFGTGAHSVVDRSNMMANTFKVFKEHPFRGVGIGGIGTYMLSRPGSFHVVPTSTGWDALEPINISAEILAGLGIFGFLIWLWLIFIVMKELIFVYRKPSVPAEYRFICLGLLIGFLIELFLLQFNQNFLRPYLWLHIAISLSAAYALRNIYELK